MFENVYLCDSEIEVRAMVAGGPARKRLPTKQKYLSSPNGVFVLQLRGPISKYGDEMSQSLIDFAWKLQAATADPTIGLVVVECDSGGGTVAGAFEAATAIVAAAKRKRVVALCEDLMASAALLICSGATEIYATQRTALIGSIGTVLILADDSELLNRIGVKLNRFRSGHLKLSGSGIPLTDDERNYLQKMVMFVTTEFTNHVSINRGINPAKMQELATGELWPATEALKLNLIDGIRTFEQVILEADAPLMRLASDAAMYSTLIEARAFNTTPIVGMKCLPEASRMEAEEHIERTHPALAKAHKKFDALPTWQRDELTALVQKGQRS